jgi:glucokinase
VYVDNDSKGAALGEFLYGAGRGTRNMVCLTVGTGVGGGLVLDGKLVHGAQGLAGLAGVMSVDMHGERCPSGAMGCLEHYASGSGIARAARTTLRAGRTSVLREDAGGNIEAVTSEMVFAAAKRGDAVATKTVRDAAYALGIAISTLLHLLNPEVVVIGGGVAEQGELFLEPVRRTVAEHTIAHYLVPIKAAELGNMAGVVGAAALCWQ